MRTVPYDPSRNALYQPGSGPSLLDASAPSDELLSVEAARLVYRPFEKHPAIAREIRQTLGRVGFSQVDFFCSFGVPSLAAASEMTGTVIVAFRGTSRQLSDVLTDLKTWSKLWPAGGRVHTGFCAAFERHRAGLGTWLKAHPGRRVFTGHSLGGALATLAAAIFQPARLITFGAPRVGDAAFGSTMSGVESRRYVGCCDMIVRVPPELLGFRHCGELRYIDHNGVIHQSPSADVITEDRRLGRSDYAQNYVSLPGSLKLRDLADHAPLNYAYPIKALDELQLGTSL